ncbi:MAG TPA: hypothetical protein VEH81_10585 [Ktedonobacteraceae bacterium]|nr:hypothetical protein [Ktedonobacteraceae bacterium]
MTPHPYIYEKMVASHHAQIQHEMQQTRRLAQVSQRRTLVRFTVRRLGRLLIVLGSHMQRTDQRNEASIPSS